MEELDDWRESRAAAGGTGDAARPPPPKRDYGPPPPLWSIHHGTVKNVREFGAFVAMPGYQRHGLVHISQMAKYKVASAADAAEVGDRVWVKVIGLQDDRISLSMRVVDQTTGQDLDPENVDVAKRSRGGADEEEAKPEDAIINHTCRKCGTVGHFEWNCFNSTALAPVLVGDFQETALPEDPDHPSAEPPPPPPPDKETADRLSRLVPEPTGAQKELEERIERRRAELADREKAAKEAKMAKLQRKLERARRREERAKEKSAGGHHHHHHKHHHDEEKKDKGAAAPATPVTPGAPAAAPMTVAEARALLERVSKKKKDSIRPPTDAGAPSAAPATASLSATALAERKQDLRKRMEESLSSPAPSSLTPPSQAVLDFKQRLAAKTAQALQSFLPPPPVEEPVLMQHTEMHAQHVSPMHPRPTSPRSVHTSPKGNTPVSARKPFSPEINEYPASMTQRHSDVPVFERLHSAAKQSQQRLEQARQTEEQPVEHRPRINRHSEAIQRDGNVEDILLRRHEEYRARREELSRLKEEHEPPLARCHRWCRALIPHGQFLHGRSRGRCLGWRFICLGVWGGRSCPAAVARINKVPAEVAREPFMQRLQDFQRSKARHTHTPPRPP
ncbi:putative nucleolar protein of 40 kDa [Paratrimastix pyriformis]|uniref:Nucleolar protein of 40 kDa n=1 Tax=Paratrimastix pyriformis TaxID=342808 RepID=A0ABQ8UBZ8_9EUKA|nr:putative nucleolar protein of 40 kDa [Paratrimastix pyriformis]